jgi:dienelactone hydrolase
VVGGEGLNNLRYGLPGEVKDLVSAIEFLKARPEVDSRRIALVGKSLGGFVSLMAAAERPDLRAVISLAGGYGFGDRSMGPVMLFVQSELQGAARRIKVFNSAHAR